MSCFDFSFVLHIRIVISILSNIRDGHYFPQKNACFSLHRHSFLLLMATTVRGRCSTACCSLCSFVTRGFERHIHVSVGRHMLPVTTLIGHLRATNDLPNDTWEYCDNFLNDTWASRRVIFGFTEKTGLKRKTVTIAAFNPRTI